MLEKLRQFFILGDSQLKLAILATLTGVLAGVVIILFRMWIDLSQFTLLPSGQADNFSGMAWYQVLALPTFGGLIIGLLFYGLSAEQRSIGVVHVIERLSSHEGRLPWQNAVRQFTGAGIALISGHAVGREGPSVHLGAASGSVLGTVLELPNNGVRILVASGIAAAISASFDTPLAGVIFAMEVVMMEYHIASFIPIILSSVSGAVLSRLAFGADPIFGTLSAHMQSLWDLPYVIVIGIIIGLTSTLFIRSLMFFSHWLTHYPLWLRTTLAGLLVGTGGLILPEVMGMSYVVLDSAHLQTLTFTTLILLMGLKLLLSTACIGLGIPGGLIGPTLVIGAACGTALGLAGQYFMPDYASSLSFYTMIGMCTMMAATLRAPLAALIALLELTATPQILLPGMLAIVCATLIVSEGFKLKALFLILLHARGLDYRNDPISQALRRISVSEAMQRDFEILPVHVDRARIEQSLLNNPTWILIERDSTPVSLMPAADLVRTLKDDAEHTDFDLMQIPASRQDVHPLSLHSSLQEALDVLNQHHVEALYITRVTAPMIQRIYGILTRQDVESSYQPPKPTYSSSSSE